MELYHTNGHRLGTYICEKSVLLLSFLHSKDFAGGLGYNVSKTHAALRRAAAYTCTSGREMGTIMDFGKNFVFGAATSAYQIEGAAHEGGKGPSIWDAFSHQRGAVKNDQNGDIACDHYHRYHEDIALLSDLGAGAYRFSISWARVIPDGDGAVNKEGLLFYHKLIDGLLERNIEPYITLFHWDLPYALHKKGGWLNRDSVEWFTRYARLIAKEFSGKVRHFITMNEPQCFIGLGYAQGKFAPGLILPPRDVFTMAHHVMLAHGSAVRAMRSSAKGDIQIGYAPTGSMHSPLTEAPRDIEAARHALFALPDDTSNWTWNVSWWSDPVLLGSYPEEGLGKYAGCLPDITKDDLKLMNQPLEFLGQIFYYVNAVRAGEDGRPEFVMRPDGYPRTGNYWPVTEDCIYWGLRFLHERYRLPLYITENGVVCPDVVSLDGRVHDPNRIDFLHRYLRSVRSAVADGVPVKGYFCWSLLDNYEWASGFDERFGLVHVNYQTQERTPKDSFFWFQKVIETNGSNL